MEPHEQPINQIPVQEANKKRISILPPIIVLLIVIFSISAFFILSKLFNISVASIPQVTLSKGNISPTPIPFVEMTIPYLREKTFKNSLSSPTPISNNSNYQSFLTSYDSDGYKINALLTIPNVDMPLGGFPAIVFVHGYLDPTSYITNGSPYSSYVDFLARNGFVVLKIDLRGHGNSEGEPGGGYYGSDYILDTLNAYAALESFKTVNASKIGLWGHSMAGHVLLRSFVIHPNLPAVNVWGGAVFTYTDRLKYGINDNSYRPPATANQTRRRRTELIEKYGDFKENSLFWSKVAPTNYLNDIKGALQLNHAIDDGTVSIGYSRDLVKLLSKTDVNFELKEYPSGGHDIEGSNFIVAMQNTVDFFNKYLKGE